KGVPFSAAVAYLLAGPIVNPLVAASTAVAYFFNWKMVALRLGLGYLAAVSVGLIVNFLTSENDRLAHDSRPVSDGCACGHDHSEHDHHEHAHDHHSHDDSPVKPKMMGRIHQALVHGGQDFLEVACFLVAGAFFAAAAQTFVNRQLVTEVMSENWLAIIIMMALAVALNLCSEADAFVAASFRHLVGVPGQLGFLVLGPMFDLKLFFMYFSIFSRRTAVILAITTILTVYLLVWLTSFFIGGMSA
ncbi:MAG: permease, partial [Candidatus Riflebacteria bacterium]